VHNTDILGVRPSVTAVCSDLW